LSVGFHQTVWGNAKKCPTLLLTPLLVRFVSRDLMALSPSLQKFSL